ncbi:AimR family lysis-lysogeny pheromone receptor [Bacillus inaquosorum]|uniref:AimR family lysis-lysogeny pheromone receptor n=1 Tax=Bacillus inaquosorum TaxID=483913 RepID=UPI0022809614|nr:AimR family lysis-lysogeny pheromone receptor [Bacillus inaquosorum]MCY9061024.1 AimR family lysis-lysogeny pheromone receptor [Bacillus inaquosorum]
MKSISDDVFDTMEDQDLGVDALAEALGIHVNSLYTFKKTGTIGFRSLLKISQICYGERYHEKMREWCMQLSTTEAIKHAFEYAAIKRDIELLSRLLQNAGGDSSLEGYYNLYGLIYGYMIDVVSFTQLNKELQRVKVAKDKVLLILVDIYKCYALYFEKDFLGIRMRAEAIKNEINKLKGERKIFFKECYTIRLSELLMPINLHFRELSECRAEAKIIINADISFKTQSDAYYCLAMSYLGIDKNRALAYIEKSLDLMKKVGNSGLVRESISHKNLFIDYYCCRETGVLPDITMYDNKLRMGDDSDFIKYFQFRSQNSLEGLYLGYKHFFSKMNFLFCNLIADDLAGFGVDPLQVEALKSINFNKKESGLVNEENLVSSFNYRLCSCRSIVS